MLKCFFLDLVILNSTLLSRYQEEVDCVSFGKGQDGVHGSLDWNKLPGQLGNTGRITLTEEIVHIGVTSTSL